MESVFRVGDDMPDMSSPSRTLSFALLAIFVFIFGIGAVAALEVGAVAGEQETDVTEEWSPNENVSMVADLNASGNAQWTITATIDLETEDDIEAFREVADKFEDGETSQLGHETFEVAADSVDRHTERGMAIQNIQRERASEAEIEDGTGTLSVSFTWTNFARLDGNQMIIDDVLVTEAGDVWLDGLYDQQSLTIVPPPGYGVRDANVRAQNGQLHWDGPQDFDSTSLRATFIGPGNTGNESNGDDPDEAGLTLLWLLLPITLIGIVIAAYIARFKNVQIDIPPVFGTDNKETTKTDRTAATETAGPASDAETETAETETTVDAETTASGVTEDTETTDETTEDDSIDEELLSDEERVERLLSENGGRMKQANIVKETDWSNAKVSQLLSSMEEDGRIDKLRIGRENLISFPEEDITNSDE